MTRDGRIPGIPLISNRLKEPGRGTARDKAEIFFQLRRGEGPMWTNIRKGPDMIFKFDNLDSDQTVPSPGIHGKKRGGCHASTR